MNAVADKFEQFEWLTYGITAKSPQFSDEAHGTGEKPLDYQDRLGAIASMETQLEKSITSVIVFGQKSKADFDYIQDHLARILVVNAKEDGKRDPKTIQMDELGKKIAWMVLMYALSPEMERQHTAYGRLCFAGQLQNHMTEDAYRVSWKKYENLMVIAIETSIRCAAEAVEKYRKNTYKDMGA
ncbi:hypothetical protein ACK1JC_06045 [Acinetobacter sp. TY2]|uniref:hypothetical protein n=1 Tax=Acinetobacter sp. TY2 TaxID=3387403 RepID=UPI003917889D